MKKSVMLFPFHAALKDGTLPPGWLADALREAGADGVELMDSLHAEAPAVFTALRKAAARAGLAIACHDIGINMLGDDAGRADRHARIRGRLDFTREVLDCGTALVYSATPVPGADLDAARALYGEYLAGFADYARPRGITVTFEDYDPVPDFVCAAGHCLHVLRAARGKVGFTFDTGNFICAGGDATAAYPLLREYTAHVHLKDRPVKPRPRAPGRLGEGGIGIAGIVRSLKRDGYGGWLSVEPGSGRLEDATDALRYLAALA